MEGLFITLEGPDGSGKTTILNELAREFKKDGIEIVKTREPGGTFIGERIRDIILDIDNDNLSYEAEALLYSASRAQHIHEVIEPGLRDGRLVISDRYLLSSLAYQGIGRDLGVENVKSINDFGLRGIEPDLILFFHIDPEETLKRKMEEDGGDRLEQEGDFFHRKVYDGYMELLERYPENVEIIDARKSIEEVVDQAMAIIKNKIDERGLIL